MFRSQSFAHAVVDEFLRVVLSRVEGGVRQELVVEAQQGSLGLARSREGHSGVFAFAEEGVGVLQGVEAGLG